MRERAKDERIAALEEQLRLSIIDAANNEAEANDLRERIAKNAALAAELEAVMALDRPRMLTNDIPGVDCYAVPELLTDRVVAALKGE